MNIPSTLNVKEHKDSFEKALADLQLNTEDEPTEKEFKKLLERSKKDENPKGNDGKTDTKDNR